MRAFVIMPFASDYNDIFQLGIKQTAANEGVHAYRLDEELFDQGMLEKIYHEIEDCDFLIADLSDRNANVFYELGYAHAKEKLCILITSRSEEIPFDLKHKRHIVYAGSLVNLKKELQKNIVWAKDEIEKRRKSPFKVDLKASGVLSLTDTTAEAELDLSIELENKLNKTAPEIHSVHLHSTKKWKVKQDGRELPCKQSNIKPYNYQFLANTPQNKLPKAGWTVITLKLSRYLANTYEGGVLKSEYTIHGNLHLEINTEKGTYLETLPISVHIDTLPF